MNTDAPNSEPCENLAYPRHAATCVRVRANAYSRRSGCQSGRESTHGLRGKLGHRVR